MYCYVFRLQRGSAKSPLAPSSQDLLGQAETIITTMIVNFWQNLALSEIDIFLQSK